jgi:hypothetical protein
LLRLVGAACRGQRDPGQRERTVLAAGSGAVLALVVAFALLALFVRITRQLGDLFSHLFQVAATVGTALVMIIIVAVLTIVLLLHR